MVNCGRSICCSTFKSAIPSISAIACLMRFPITNILFKSSPKSLMAIFALVPDNIASIRWLMGWPISIFAPEIIDSFLRTSAISSLRDLSFRIKGASISDTLTPNACSSSSALPVLRATVCISGIESKACSACNPKRLLSSSEIPGSELTLIVNEPSLKEGRKLLPRFRNVTSAAINKTAVPASTMRLLANAHIKLLR